MVRDFVAQVKGRIAIDSREGAGTAVHLFLPRADDAPAGQAAG